MIDFSGYTAKAIEKSMLGRVSEGIDTREGSMVQTAVGPAAWYLEGMYMELAKVQENAYAGTARGDALDMIVPERGISRKAATRAVRKGTFNVRVAPGSQFKTINGADSLIFISGDPVPDAGGGYAYAMACAVPGTAGNNYVGGLLPITAIAGLTSAALSDIIIPGAEEETDEALRERFYETFRVAAFGGNIQAYRNGILEIEGVGAVQVYPASLWKGGGTVLCSILDDTLNPAAPAVVQNVQDIICPAEEGGRAPSADGYGMAPIGAKVTITTAAQLTLNIACTIEFSASVQNGAEAYQETIEEKIQEYLDTVKQAWGRMLKGHSVSYPVIVYISRITFAILTIPEVVNVADVLVNGSREDLHLVETAELQQIPVLGRVAINGG